MENNVFNTLSKINVSGKTEKKNGLTYLSWAYAWAEVKKLYPTAQYHVYERDTQWGPVNYFTDGRTCWVKVGVTIEGLEYIEMLPIMDYRNKSIALDKVTSCDVNKTIQRAITKAIGRQGLGLYVYAGEDFPESESQSQNTVRPTQAQPVNKPVEVAPQAPAQPAQAPVKDTRPVTPGMLDSIRKGIEEYHVSEEFVCRAYRVKKLSDLRVFQAQHISKNIGGKLKTMYLADIVKNAKQREMPTTFADAICPPPQQEKTEGEKISLESLGLSPADLDALTECGNVFN